MIYMFVYVVEAFITLNWKDYYKHKSPFSSLLLVCRHLLFSIEFSYMRGFYFTVTHACHLGLQ